jgi:hypothetical protein
MKVNTLQLITIVLIGNLALMYGHRADAPADYAVLISGDSPTLEKSYGANLERPLDEFWNDLYLMWELHYTKTGMWDRSNDIGGEIRALYADGVDYPYAHPRYQASWNNVARITDYPATYNYVYNIFYWLKNGEQSQQIWHGMAEDEELFNWTFDHGAWNGANAYLGLWDVWVRDDLYASWVNPINAGKKVFWMQQCHSGGFIDDLAGNTSVVITVCSPTELASPADNVSRNGSPLPENEYGNHHGEFDFHVMNAARGTAIYPYGNPTIVDADDNENGGVSMEEVFNYVYYHESQDETPQYSDVGNIGANTYLDYEPPTAPPNLTGFWNRNGVYLDWDPATDNETAIEYYFVKRSPQFPPGQIDTFTSNTGFYDWTVRSYTEYTYRIFAFDLALNIGLQSTIHITTGFVNPPIPKEGPQIAAEQAMCGLSFVNINQNPVRENAVITFSNAVPGYVSLAIYDVQGKKVRDILNAYKPEGIHSVDFAAERMESGIYFLRLDSRGFSDVQKIIVAK